MFSLFVPFQDDTERMAFGRMVGLAAKGMDEEAFETFQYEVGQLIVKYKRDTRARKLVQPPATQSRPVHPPAVQPTASQPNLDFQVAVNMAAQQQEHCPAGYLPEWQSNFQGLGQPQLSRSNSAPPGGSDDLVGFHLCD